MRRKRPVQRTSDGRADKRNELAPPHCAMPHPNRYSNEKTELSGSKSGSKSVLAFFN
jgi:hypothetical protein